MESIIADTPVASIIFLFTVVTSIYTFYNPEVFSRLMLHPYTVSRGKNLHTLITSGLVHANWSHLIFNMLTFYFFGFPLEKIMAATSGWGHGQFALLYLLSMVLSDASTVYKQRNNFSYHSLGASGAISAVLFSMILFMPGMSIYLFFIPIGIPAVIFGPLYLIYCAYMARSSYDGINHDAHFYGALAGLLITIVMFPGIVPYFFGEVQGMLHR
ncbi:Rhomboid family protein [bacterium A37T11]|nr:Rhomboid family protein [bacterium A37T11]